MCYGVVVENLVVDLVGEQHQVVLARQLDDTSISTSLEYTAPVGLFGLISTRALVLGVILALHVGEIGEPAGLLVAQIMHRVAAGEGHGGGPQRVVGGRDQHFIAVVEQRLHGHHDQLGDAIAQVDVLDADAFHLLLLVVLHHRLARAEQAFGVAVALGGGQVADHVQEDFFRRLEAEGGRVADVQLEDALAFVFQALGVLEHRAANVVADVGELVGFADLHGNDPERNKRRGKMLQQTLAGQPWQCLAWVTNWGRIIRSGRPWGKGQAGLFSAWRGAHGKVAKTATGLA